MILPDAFTYDCRKFTQHVQSFWNSAWSKRYQLSGGWVGRALIDSFQKFSENERQINELSSFWKSFLPPTQVSLQTKDFPSPQMSLDTEFVISDNTHFHSNKQWWPKHRIMWLHSESSRILARILIANTFHFCGTSLERISGSFTHIIPNLQMEKRKREEARDLFWDQEKTLGSEHPGGREEKSSKDQIFWTVSSTWSW